MHYGLCFAAYSILQYLACHVVQYPQWRYSIMHCVLKMRATWLLVDRV